MSLKRWTLSNGLTVVCVPTDTKALTVSAYVKVGSRYEDRRNNGVSHFIEHLVFKGTKKRPTAQAITKLLDGVGAHYNAATAKDWTGFFAKINAEKAEIAFDVISDLVQNGIFDSREIDKERSVIVEEIKMYEENPLMNIEDLFEGALFGSHHPLGWNIAGPKEIIRRISRRDILAYRDRYYRARNMYVVVAGCVPKNVRALAEKYFGTVKAGVKMRPAKKYRPDPRLPHVKLHHQEVEQVQIALGVTSLPYNHPQLPAQTVLANILGGTMSSRLFREVREKRGLAYYVSAGASAFEDTGSFEIRAGLDKSKVDDALSVIVAELRKIKKQPVTPSEITLAKENIRGRTILNLEDSDAVASWYAQKALFGRRMETPEEALIKIKKVTAADVQKLARRLFKKEALRLAVIGPHADMNKWGEIMRSV